MADWEGGSGVEWAGKEGKTRETEERKKEKEKQLKFKIIVNQLNLPIACISLPCWRRWSDRTASLIGCCGRCSLVCALVCGCAGVSWAWA